MGEQFRSFCSGKNNVLLIIVNSVRRKEQETWTRLVGGLLRWNRPHSPSWYQGRVRGEKCCLLGTKLSRDSESETLTETK